MLPTVDFVDTGFRSRNEIVLCRGECIKQLPKPMTLDTQMTLALLQELLMALRANDANGRSVGVLIHNEAEKILIPLRFS